MAMLAAGGTVLLGFLVSLGSARSAREMREQALHLDAPLERELVRLRDAVGKGESPDKLGALADLVSPAGGGAPLRLVGSRDALRVVREAERDNPVVGVPSAERQYLIEVRLVEGPLRYTSGDAVMVVSAEVRWPYPASEVADGSLTMIMAVDG